MCGITGIFPAKYNSSVLKNTIGNMTAALEHRGPDGWGTYISDLVGLGHRRLSIIDLSGGDQPICTDNYVIVFNGEIYNYLELREELEKSGHKFITNSDTEVALRVFEQFGENAFTRFNGQFAMLIWDKKKKKLTAARDRYGIRPLYILKYNSSYFFASEVKSFKQIPGFKLNFNFENLFEHALLWNTLGDSTVYQNIRTVESGTYEIYSEDGNPPRIKRFYEIGESYNADKTKIISFEEAREEFTELLSDSIRLRLRSDVPVANYLSGGLDSSVVTYLTYKIKKEKFKIFSIRFNDKDFDESLYQDEMTKHILSKHSSVIMDYKTISEKLYDTIKHTERPVFRTAPVPMFCLSKLVRSNNIKVVLTGEAADEILYGYDSYKELRLLELMSNNAEKTAIDSFISMLYPHLHHYKDKKRIGFLKMYYEDLVPYYDNELVSLNIRLNNNSVIKNYFNKDFNIEFDRNKVLERVRSILPENYKSFTLLQKNQFLEMKTLLSGYLLSSQGDRMSLSHGVEGRYPFLDHKIVETLFNYPDEYKLKGLSQKYILKETFKGKIPGSIIKRPKLPYMAPDLKSFFKNGKLVDSINEFLSDSSINTHGIFNNKFIKRLIRKYEDRPIDKIGYRDNMLMTFIISTQMIDYMNKQKDDYELEQKNNKVDIEELKSK